MEAIKNQLKEAIKAALPNGESIYVDVQEYRYQEDYFKLHEELYEKKDFWENVEFEEEQIKAAALEYMQENDIAVDETDPECWEEYHTEGRQKLEEALPYWTIYFEPRTIDYEAAQKCGLTAFEYDGTFMLALGGCGMDLSPKLHAYQALTDGSIPKSSDILPERDNSYFKYVVGESVMNEALAACKRETPHIVISMDLAKEEVKTQ